MANGIQVPVSLYVENLQKIINDLKGQLGNLKVGSSGFKAMENNIRQLQKELDKFQIQASKPFLTENQFIQAEKSVGRLEDEIEKVSITASRLKFSDLELNADQKEQLKAVEDQITAIKASLKAAKDEAKKSFLGSDLGQKWVDLHPDDATRTLDQITTRIRNAVQAQSDEVKKAEEVVAQYKRTITMGDIASNVAKSTKGLKSDSKSARGLEALMGKEFSDFFTKHANGDVAGFKSGQKGFFAQWLTKNFDIDPQVIQDLVAKTAPEIARALNNAQSMIRQELNKSITNANDANIKMPAADLNVTKQNAELSELTSYLKQAIDANGQMKLSEDQLREALAAAGVTLENTKESIAADVRAKEEWRQANQRGTAELENLKNALAETNAQFLQQQRVTQNFNAMKMAVVNFMGFRQVLNLTKNAIREAINHIKELDSVMNKISIVTDMSMDQLWDQVDAYSKMAQTYGVSIKGAYEVSQIYYQQGLETNDVLTLTNETLKLAKISGLDYAQTTDYMTTALRGFKMEMSEASKVVDVYSNLAAHTAVSQEELAVAMSKTASSLESVGATFEEGSAMIGTMVAVTRESATNIGSALKSIASRYGEMKKDPLALTDAEGDALDYNKVDTALRSVGISLKDTEGQFRSMTDVILELSSVWDQLESTQQRYIATQFAGNRQQSRFLALVSNPELLKANLNFANNSEDIGTLQAIKALDSVEAKLEQVRVAYQQFYTTIGIQDVWKTLLDGTKNVINTLNGLPKLFGKIPLGAIAAVSNIITLIKSLLTRGIQSIAAIWSNALSKSGTQATTQGQTIGRNLMQSIETEIKKGTPAVQAAINAALSLQQQQQPVANVVPLNGRQQQLFQIGTTNLDQKPYAMQRLAENYAQNGMMLQAEYSKAAAIGTEEAYRQAIERSNEAIRQQSGILRENTGEINGNVGATNAGITSKISFFDKLKDGSSKLNRGLMATSMALTTIGMVLDKSSESGRIASGVFTGLGGAIQTGLSAARVFAGDWSALPQLIMGVINVINGVGIAVETPAERLERLTKEAEELSNKSKEEKANYRTLDNSVKKVEELAERRYESAEAAEEYAEAANDLAEKFPALVVGFDESGNAIVDLTNKEEILLAARKKAAQAAFDAAQAELKKTKEEQQNRVNTARESLSSANQGADDIELKTTSSIEQARHDRISQIKNLSQELVWKYGNDTSIIANLQEINTSAQELFNEEGYETAEGYKAWIDSIQHQLDIVKKHSSGDLLKDEYFLQIENLLDTPLEDLSAETKFQSANYFETLQENLSKLKSLDPMSEEADLLMKETTILLNQKDQYADIVQIHEDEFTSIQTGFDNYKDAVKEFKSFTASEKGYSKILISNWQDIQRGTENGWTYLEDSSSAAALVTDAIYKQYEKRVDDYDLTAENIRITATRSKAPELMEAFWENLDNSQKKLFDKMFNDSNTYTDEDFERAFGDVKNFKEAYDIIKLYYKDNIKKIGERITEQLKNTNFINKETADKYESFKDKIKTRDQEDIFNSVLKRYNELYSNGFGVIAETYATESIDVLENIFQITDLEVRTNLLNSIHESGMLTAEGIDDIIKVIEETEGLSTEDREKLIKEFTDVKQTVYNNISLSLQSGIDNFLESWKDASKTLSSLTSGVDLTDVGSIINSKVGQNLKLSFSDFVQDGDKLILQADLVDQYYEEYFKAEREKLGEYSEEIEKITLNYSSAIKASKNKKLVNYFQIDSQQAYDIEKIIGTNQLKEYAEFNEALNAWLVKDAEGLTKAIEEGLININNNIELYDQYLVSAKEQIDKSRQWAEGNYSSLSNIYKTLKNTQSFSGQTVNQRLTKLVSGVEKMTKEELAQPDIANAIKQIRSAYDNYIDDLVSKDIQTLYAEDYVQTGRGKDIIAKEMENAQNKTAIEFAQWIAGLSKTAGKTIAEQNDAFVNAWEKNHNKETLDGIKDVQFLDDKYFSASIDQLKTFANTYGLSIDQMVTYGIAQYNKALDSWVVDYSNLDTLGLDLNSIDDFKETVADSVNNFLDSLGDSIKKALEGSLSNVEAKQLQQQVHDLGYTGTLDFSKTAERLNLSEQSALSLYTYLKQTNSLQADLMFEQMNKSLKESNEYYKSISSIESRIVKLNEEIAKLPVDDKRRKKYEEELALAKEIRAVRSTSEDAEFNFMSNKIPGGQNNPINYYQNWAQAFQKISEASKLSATNSTGTHKGLIDYQDWYNIITEMGNIASLTEEGIQIGNRTLHNAQDAADLIKAGADALTIDSSGNVKVAMGDIADLGIDFSSGMEGFSKGVDEGIKKVAQSQVDMLDSMIQLMETVVAMQKLGDVDVDANNKLDIDEMFRVEYEDDGKTIKAIREFTQTYRDAHNELISWAKTDEGAEFKKTLETMSISWNGADETMWSLLNKEEEDVKQWSDELKGQYATLVSSLYAVAMSGDFAPDRIFDSIKQVFAESGFEGEIPVGDTHLVFKYNTSLEKGKDGKYHIGDKEFPGDDSGFKAAISYQKATELTALQGIKSEYDEDGSITFKHDFITNVDYNVKDGKYNIKFEDGSIATATSKEGANLAIATYAEMTNQDVENTGAQVTEAKPIEFTIQQEGYANLIFTVKDGKSEVKVDGQGNHENLLNAQHAIAKTSNKVNTIFNEQTDLDLTIGVDESSAIEAGKSAKQIAEDAANADPAKIHFIYDITPEEAKTRKQAEQQAHDAAIDNEAKDPNDKKNNARRKVTAVQTYEDDLNQIPNGEIESFEQSTNNSKTKMKTIGKATQLVQGEDTENTNKKSSFGNEQQEAQNDRYKAEQAAARKEQFDKQAQEAQNARYEAEQAARKFQFDKQVQDAQNERYKAEQAAAKKEQFNKYAQTDTQFQLSLLKQQYKDEFESAGETISEGIAKGMVQKPTIVQDSAKNLYNYIEQSFRIAADANSPAKNMIPWGESITDGIIVGMLSRSDSLAATAKQLFDLLQAALFGEEYTLDNIFTDKVLSLTPPGVTIESNNDQEDSSSNSTIATVVNNLDDTKSAFASTTSELETFKGTIPIENFQGLNSESNNLKSGFSKVNSQTSTAERNIRELGSTSNSTKTPIYELGKEADIARGHVSKFGELAGGAEHPVDELGNAAATATGQVTTIGSAAGTAAGAIDGLSGAASAAAAALGNIEVNVAVNVATVGSSGGSPQSSSGSKSSRPNFVPGATGTIGLANAKGTLMGELGPELVVSNGRYFVVGQSGPEIVSLAEDAIVFNHLQTKSLLEKGTSSGRGHAITNEYKATSYAKGNVSGGPAMADAASALAALKQLRAQWQALLSLSAKDLISKGSGGGGGGGNDAAFVKSLERWYNLLQEIAKLEQKITYEQNKRSKIQSDFVRSGKEYFQSQKDSLKYLEAERRMHQQLVDEQKEYFAQRRAELNTQSAFSSLYTFDESGQIKYKQGKFAELTNRFGGDSTSGKPNYSVKEQYDWLISQGYGYAMQYNDSGEKIDTKNGKDEAAMKTAIEAFWAKIESDQGEMQELHDSIEEHKNAVLEKQEEQNKILHEIEDNQLEVENRVMKAVEDQAQRQIDELQKQKDAIQESNEALLKGLNDQLSKERQMYENQQSERDLDTKRRRLSILQRSGGSAAEIASLQAEIDTESRDIYFEKQQEQIDAIQEASDNQLEKLQQQIDLMTEALEYEKENGLLWAQVYEQMVKSPTEIADFIKQNDSSYWGKSPADMAKSMRDDLFEAEKWKAYAEDGQGNIENYLAIIAAAVDEEEKERQRKEAEESQQSVMTTATVSQDTGITSGGTDHGKIDHYNYESLDSAKHKKIPIYSDGWTGTSSIEPHSVKSYKYIGSERHGICACGQDMGPAQGTVGAEKTQQDTKKPILRKGINYTYDYGGIVPEDQLALVHAKESVLTAKQTALLRNEILGSKPNSLMNLLMDFREAYNGLNETTYTNIHDQGNITFEHAEVNVKVDKLANDYDAARAGDNIMKEMLNIARKTNAQNRVGR